MGIQGYKVVTVPHGVKSFDTDIEWSPDIVDYPSHPAYGPLISRASARRRLAAGAVFAKSMMPLLVKRLVRYEMIPLEKRTPRSLGDWMDLLGISLQNALGVSSPKLMHPEESEVLSSLEANGCCVVQMDGALFGELHQKASSYFQRLEERRKRSLSGERAFDESRGSVDKRKDGENLFQELDKILSESGILDAASHYLGREARLVDVNPQINDATDSFWRNIFPDLKLRDLPSCAYCHRDASGGDLKAIFYMSDVGLNNGPFSYVVGSNKLKMTRLDNFIAEANDHNGLSSTALDAREKFAALPAKLRQKGSFGNDLQDESRLAKEISQGMWNITGEKGSIVLFDTKGIHRGGMVVDGTRYVITTVIG